MRPVRYCIVWAKCNCAELEALGSDELLRNIHRVKDESVGKSIYLARPLHCGRMPDQEDVDHVECALTPGFCRWHDPAGARYQIICVKRKGHIARVIARPL